MKVNSDRIWERINKLGEIGKSKKGGISRFAFTPEDKEAIAMVIEWMKEANLKVRKDTVGNVYARKDGREDGPVVLTGSHLDTVPEGGKFDGAAGVIAALECLQVMDENDIQTKFPVEVIIMVNEEGSRFPGGLMGSMAINGKLPLDFPFTIKDQNGILLADAMRKAGAEPDKIIEASKDEKEIFAFFELHIEQAKVLEKVNKPVGIVSAIAGPHQLKLVVYGESGHAGATPMNDRRDPMVAAGMIIKEVEELVNKSQSEIRGTVGYIKAFPGGHNIIPEKVELTLDFRDINENTRNEVINDLKNYISKICNERNLTFDLKATQKTPPVHINSMIINLMKNIAEDINIPHKVMPSWAAHDAMVMSEISEIGMVFIRSKKGLSHCPEEYSSKEDIASGTELLFHTLIETADRECKNRVVD